MVWGSACLLRDCDVVMIDQERDGDMASVH